MITLDKNYVLKVGKGTNIINSLYLYWFQTLIPKRKKREIEIEAERKEKGRCLP